MVTGYSYAAHSVSLLANSEDFFSDAVNYGISLHVLNLSLRQKAKASLFKGISLGFVGIWVAFETYSICRNIRFAFAIRPKAGKSRDSS